MGSSVTYHPATFAEFFEPIDKLYPRLSQKLAEDFKVYIDSSRGIVPKYMGRDAPYMQPIEAERAHLSHVHIRLPPGEFRQDVAQYFRVCRKGFPGEDAALVYVQGFLEEDRFLLIALLWPDAHGMAQRRPLMRYFSQIASDWRDEN
ncbi:mRNA interferase YafO [Pseudomonas syringae]|uniref:type II toxin-antitoxin system YafO family toxin n=1 Tax=Pseudomonas syringae group TaxID=136849 RepID=UPI000894D10B|nr:MULTISPECIES: type II toxin-antitoxin system YafO family toxin [Pseudomonas syringae group]SDZ53511.1 mRNA interferase YafO [Pseudomonas syringae]